MLDYTTYIRDRISELREEKGVSEYQMSLDLGQNRNYIQGITSGKSLPSMSQFLNICEYFGISPMHFFGSKELYPQLLYEAMKKMSSLNQSDMLLLLSIIDRFQQE